jgi:hypothetical protein
MREWVTTYCGSKNGALVFKCTWLNSIAARLGEEDGDVIALGIVI